MARVAAALREVTKAYPGTLAARGVTIEFLSGEIHALVGENGAGKSTLVNILSGLIQPDSGTVEIDGQAVRLNSVGASLAEGIGVVHQSGSLIETLTVGENLRLARMLAPKPHAYSRTVNASFSLPNEITEQSFVYQLSPRQRQLVEIHRLLMQNARILVLDEPTAMLSPQESKHLFRELRMLARAGYTVIIVSHKLSELVDVDTKRRRDFNCHRFTVISKGQVVDRIPRTVFSAERLLKYLGGAADDKPRATGDSAAAADRKDAAKPDRARKALVSLKSVCTAPAAGEPLRDVDLTPRGGEILGLAGRGASGVVRILLGERGEMTGGSVEWSKDATAGGDDLAVGFVPARAPRGVIASLTVNENLALRRRNFLGLARSSACRRERRAFFDTLIRDFDIRPPKSTALLRTLSGGNVRKVLLAREVEYAKTLLLAENPTAGLDQAAAAFVRRVLRLKAEGGACVVVHSDDLDELVSLCDRIAVFSAGRCVAELEGAEISSEAIGVALVGFADLPVPAAGPKKRAQGGVAACAD